MKEQRHTLVLGTSGTGKSYRTKQLLKGANRLVVIDPMGEYSGHAVDVGSASWKSKFLNHIQAHWKKGFKISLRGEPDWTRVGHELWGLLKQMQAGYASGNSNAKIVLVIEEADQVAPTHNLPVELRGIQKDMSNRGRHYGVDFLAVSQYPTQVYPGLRSNLKTTIFFRLADLKDQRWAAEALAGAINSNKTKAQWVREIATLKLGQHWVLQGGMASKRGPGT